VGQPLHEIVAIDIIDENLAPFNPSADDVVKRTGDINSGLSGHGDKVSKAGRDKNALFHPLISPF